MCHARDDLADGYNLMGKRHMKAAARYAMLVAMMPTPTPNPT
jgi:hypothetical protein